MTGLADVAHRVIRCHISQGTRAQKALDDRAWRIIRYLTTQETKVRHASYDVASNSCQALDTGAPAPENAQNNLGAIFEAIAGENQNGNENLRSLGSLDAPTADDYESASG